MEFTEEERKQMLEALKEQLRREEEAAYISGPFRFECELPKSTGPIPIVDPNAKSTTTTPTSSSPPLNAFAKDFIPGNMPATEDVDQYGIPRSKVYYWKPIVMTTPSGQSFKIEKGNVSGDKKARADPWAPSYVRRG
jgi:hypothetical protein